MKYKAVIFDLFGTLVENSSRTEYERILGEMADVLGAPRREFTQLWFDTFYLRSTGVLSSPEGNIDQICKQLGVNFTDKQLKQASRIRFAFYIRSLIPRTDALATLGFLRANGYKVGLISDCSTEIVDTWKDTPFAALVDVAIFSCTAGVKKPDPRIYQMALDRLGVEAKDCLYIGDGSSHELSGAKEVGMHPVLIRVPYETGTDAYRIDEEEWQGPVVSLLSEVIGLLQIRAKSGLL